jgi:outer membrane protein assembly factor BamB
MFFPHPSTWRLSCAAALALVMFLVAGGRSRSQDWPQWRGPLGQGITSAKNLPPAAGAGSLKVLWKTPIPGEGCSSPVVSQGRVYLTTAYEGTQRHPWDEPAFWAFVILSCGVAGLALTQVPRVCRSFAPSPVLLAGLAVWTMAVVVLTAVILAKPTWFWQFADPWTGTTLASADLPWVESLNLRPAIVLVCGSLLLIFIFLTGDAPLLTSWLGFLTLAVTLVCTLLLGLIGWRPDWFFQAGQPWLAWLVTGGVGLFALAAIIGWLRERHTLRLLAAGISLGVAAWLFQDTPNDEFGEPLNLQNRITYLAPGLMLLVLQASASFLLSGEGSRGSGRSFTLSPCHPVTLSFLLAVLVFVRANYLQAESGVVRAVVCVDSQSGEVLWTTPVYVAAAEKRHSLNSQATPTPACDGERVYAYFGSGLAALDTSGRLLWLQRDPEFPGFIRYGAGSSVVLAGDRIIVYRDSEFMGHGDHLDDDIHTQSNRRPSALTAHDARTGAEIWTVTPPFSHDSYMTPLVWTRDDRLEVVIATWKTLAGFAASDGSLLWKHSYPMQQIVPSPAVHGDSLIVTGGNLTAGPILAVRPPSAAKGTSADTIWFNGKTGSNIVSPVCWDGMLFSMSHIGVLTCRDAETGRPHWEKRLGGRCLASLVAGDGKVYALDQHGTLHAIAASTTGTMLASLSLEENCSATPALVGGMIFVRTAGHLYCLGSGE